MLNKLVAAVEPAVVIVICPDINSKGSGFLVNEEGYIITNNHVVAKKTLQNGVLSFTYSSNIIVVIEGSQHSAKLEISQQDDRPIVYDYAILKVDGLVKPIFLELADGSIARR